MRKTPERIAFVKTGWGTHYAGEIIVGRHGHIDSFEEAHEKFNFQPSIDGKYYGYLPPIGKAFRAPQPKEPEDWLVIFVAAKNGTGSLTVVGWYENANFYYEYESRPEYAAGAPFPTDNDGNHFSYCISASEAYLIPSEDRDMIVSGAHFKRTPIVYVKGGEKEDPWRDELAEQALSLINTYKNEKATSSNKAAFPDAEHRKKVEEAAVKIAVEYLEAMSFQVTDRQKDNCGYDLLAQRTEKTPKELHIEVKGTSSSTKRFFISQQEYSYMSNPKWRLLLVTGALDKPEVHLLNQKQVNKMFSFSPLSWAVTEK